MNGAFLDSVSLEPSDLDLTSLESCFTTLVQYPITSSDEVVARLQGVDVAIVNKVILDASLLSALPDLKHILIAATGTNNVDLAAAKQLNISVQNCQGYGVSSVAQHCMMLMLTLSTRFLDYHQAVHNGAWSKSPLFCLLDFPVSDLSGKTLGIIGYGELGQAVAALGKAFGMKVIISALPARSYTDQRVPLEAFLQQADVVSIHCPLTPETANLIAMEQLQLMGPSALLINCARGGIVNEHDLLKALSNKVIAGAATDVLTEEPPRPNHPMLQYKANNLIITPHSAWVSKNARQTIVHQLVDNIKSVTTEYPQFLVN